MSFLRTRKGYTPRWPYLYIAIIELSPNNVTVAGTDVRVCSDYLNCFALKNLLQKLFSLWHFVALPNVMMRDWQIYRSYILDIFFFLVSLTFLWSTHEKRKSEQHIKNITHRKTFEYCSMRTGTNLTNHIYYYWASHSRYIFLFS